MEEVRERRFSRRRTLSAERTGPGSGPEGDRVGIQATYTTVGDKNLRQRAMVTRRFASERLD